MKKYDYTNLGILAEHYYYISFNEFGYFTDTNKRLNGNSVSIRDKVNSKYDFNFRNTQDIIDNIPNKVMYT